MAFSFPSSLAYTSIDHWHEARAARVAAELRKVETAEYKYSITHMIYVHFTLL
jgi:hypothetical protein